MEITAEVLLEHILRMQHCHVITAAAAERLDARLQAINASHDQHGLAC